MAFAPYAAPIFDIDFVGPSPMGASLGVFSEDAQEDYTKIDGPKAKAQPMIPPEIDLSEAQRKNLSNYLMDELWTCDMERRDQIEKFSRLKQKYRTKFPEFPKNFPIPNSSQITIPIIKTSTDALTSRLYQTVMAADPMASVRTKRPESEWSDFANDWEEFLNLYSNEKLDVDSVIDTAITESIKLGTSVVEATRYKESRKVVEFDSGTQKYNQQIKELYNGPIFFNIPIEDFWIRLAYQDPDKAPWCGKCVRLSWSEIKDMALSGEINPEFLENVWRLPVSDGDVPQTVRDDEKQERTEPNGRTQYRLFELRVRWDVDGDGIDEELMVWYHLESRTVLRCKFNTFRNGKRNYEVFRYKKIEYRFYGEGMAELLEQLQEEISTIHNQRIDNATIASLKIILTSKAIPGLKPGDPLWPGKIVKVQQPAESVVPFTLGEIYPSTIQNETIARGYVSEVSGIGEVALGNAQPVSRTTAAAQLSMLEELNRRFDKALKGYRKNIRNLYCYVTDMFNQTGTGGLASQWLGDVRGQMVETMITQPADVLYANIGIQVTSTKATVNREVELQTNIALMNLTIQNGQQMMQLVQGLAPQALPMVAHELISALKPIYKKVLQYSDSADPESGIRVLSFLESILPSPEDMGGMGQQAALSASAATVGGAQQANGNGAQPGGNAQLAATAGGPGLEDILSAVRGSNGGQPANGSRRNQRR